MGYFVQLKTVVLQLLMLTHIQCLNVPMPHLILASRSPTRLAILKELGFSQIVCRPADINEQSVGDRMIDRPEDLVRKIALAKAQKIVSEILASNDSGHELVLAGDQVILYEGIILEKPLDKKQAADFIRGYASFPCRTVGSVVLVDLRDRMKGPVYKVGVDSAAVHFLKGGIPENIITELLEDDACMHCAGGLMVEHPLVSPFVARIEGTIDSVMGLSKSLVKELLFELRPELAS
jgi:septum formation protein